MRVLEVGGTLDTTRELVHCTAHTDCSETSVPPNQTYIPRRQVSTRAHPFWFSEPPPNSVAHVSYSGSIWQLFERSHRTPPETKCNRLQNIVPVSNECGKNEPTTP
jgi:hypothetical protein